LAGKNRKTKWDTFTKNINAAETWVASAQSRSTDTVLPDTPNRELKPMGRGKGSSSGDISPRKVGAGTSKLTGGEKTRASLGGLRSDFFHRKKYDKHSKSGDKQRVAREQHTGPASGTQA